MIDRVKPAPTISGLAAEVARLRRAIWLMGALALASNAAIITYFSISAPR